MLVRADVGECPGDPQAPVNGKAGLVFAVAGQGHKLLCEIPPIVPEGIHVYLLLFLKGAPAAYRDDFLPAAQLLHEPGKGMGGLPFQKDVGERGENRGQILPDVHGVGMLPVY